ncbi:MAG: two-component sensor histidine kinase [Alteromonadaceae bacterium]|nr:MAG: two-component sensor histidine kinase [Alteromonadaceae bacterium]
MRKFAFLSFKALNTRILAASLVVLPALLGFSAYMLNKAFYQSQLTAEKVALLAQTYAILGLTEPLGDSLSVVGGLHDPRFATPESGLYAMVVDAEQRTVWQSNSLQISSLTVPKRESILPGTEQLQVIEISGSPYSRLSYGIVWELSGIDQQFNIVLLHSQQNMLQQLRHYQNQLFFWLGGLALLLILVQTAIIHWGLLPLKRLAEDIKQLESGRIDKLNEAYPQEILPVTNNINLLIDSEQKQRTRYQNTLGDLAHSLKTPLSVMRSILDKPPQATENERPSTASIKNGIDEQITRMANIVAHQLNRASAKSQSSFQSAINLRQIIVRLGTALAKVYHHKDIQLDIQVATELCCTLEEGDLMELLGNTLENAFKYGNSHVLVKAEQTHALTHIQIEDDGKGVSEHLRKDILQRGARADTQEPGQGIGLAVAVDIVSAYDGELSVTSSTLGGACFNIELPK